MQNITQRIDPVANKLIIEVDLGVNGGLSSSGKSFLVANSGGFAAVDGRPGYKLSLNVIKAK